MEFIVFNSPIASAGLKKMSETPVTSLKYFSGDDATEGSLSDHNSWKFILEKKLSIKSELLSISYNTMVYGNQFISLYTPFIRMCVCSMCGHMEQMQKSKKLKVKLKKSTNSIDNSKKINTDDDRSSIYKEEKKDDSNLVFTKYCTKCKKITRQKIIDKKIEDNSELNIIQWNPFNIEISKNKISGKSTYYYKPESSMSSGIKHFDLDVLSSTPLSMIEAVLSNKIFKFSDGHLYHLKRDTLNGVSSAWGMPSLAPAIPSFMNAMILKKANEKIASDYMVPLRVAYPTQTQAQGQIYNYVSGDDFVSKINKLVEKWKIDPSGVQTAPFPIGVQSILGDGKMLSVYQELEMAETNIASTLGIPIEFIKGGLSYGTQGASLRLLENQVSRVTSSLNGLIEFIIKKVAGHLNKKPISVELLPFKIIDDLQEKATIVQMASQGSYISRETLMDIFNIDAHLENKRIVHEKKEDIKSQLEMQKYQQDEQTSIEERARAEEGRENSNFNNLNQQQLLQEADAQAQQLAAMQEGQRKSTLDEMAKTNYILYATVKSRLDLMNQKQSYQAKSQMSHGQ